MYTYPSLLNDELLQTMNELDKVVKYIDVPLQHVSKNQLELMNRPTLDSKKLIKRIRKLITKVAIRKTFINGYPNETEEPHFKIKYKNATCRFLISNCEPMKAEAKNGIPVQINKIMKVKL